MPPELLEILRSGGAALAPFLGFLWWLERTERRELSEKLAMMGRDTIVAASETKAALTTLGNILNGSSGRP